MIIYLAATHTYNLGSTVNDEDIKRALNGRKLCVLESFVYLKDWMSPLIKNKHWYFMLDSGAYTFMNAKKNEGGIDWNSYCDRYADFIVENDVERFMEIDIDSIIGYKGVLKLRERLEKRTGRPSIPVWHLERGLDNYKSTCKDYPYVAMGTLQKIKKDAERWINPMADIAKSANSKLHLLGYTPAGGILDRSRFDSCDSSTWIVGNRVGLVHKFKNGKLEKTQVPKGMRMKNKEVARHNFIQWILFQGHMATRGY